MSFLLNLTVSFSVRFLFHISQNKSLSFSEWCFNFPFTLANNSFYLCYKVTTREVLLFVLILFPLKWFWWHLAFLIIMVLLQRFQLRYQYLLVNLVPVTWCYEYSIWSGFESTAMSRVASWLIVDLMVLMLLPKLKRMTGVAGRWLLIFRHMVV